MSQYKAPDGPPPNYPQPAHFDAGPVDPRAQGYYGSPPPNQQYGYGQPTPYQQEYGPPQPGQYPYQQQPMGYYPQQQPPMGYYQQDRGPGAGSGICAGILGALACCCCLDILF